MARTRQTARASTGVKVPHRVIATKAARRSAGLWPKNGQDVRERPSHRINREFIDFEDRRIAEHLSSLWEHAGRSDIAALRFQIEYGSFRIKYKAVGNRAPIVAAVSAAGARLLFGPHVLAFFAARRSRKAWFTSDRGFRLGLTESHGDDTEYKCCDDPDWVVELVWCSNGGNGETEGFYYAVGEGSHDKYLILLYRMTFVHVLRANEDVRRGFNCAFGRDSLTRTDAILAIDNWCSQNRGKRKRVNYAMSRNVSPLASRYFTRSQPVPFQDNTILCLRSAVCAAISLVAGWRAANCVWAAGSKRVSEFERRKNYSSSVHQFNHVQRALQADYHGTISLIRDHVKPPPGSFVHGRSSSRSPLWRSDVGWLLRLSTTVEAGVYVLRLNDIHGFQHAICLNARTEMALINDCAERYATQLTGSSLRLCCPAGDPTKFQYFDGIRVVHGMAKRDRSGGKCLGQEHKKRVRRGNRGPTLSHGKGRRTKGSLK